MKGTHHPQPGDWVRRPEIEGGDAVFVLELDGALFWGRTWMPERGLVLRESLYPVDSAYGWHLVPPPIDWQPPATLKTRLGLWARLLDDADVDTIGLNRSEALELANILREAVERVR